VIGPALSNGLRMDQLDVHLWETAEHLHLEEVEPNSLRPHTYYALERSYFLRPDRDVADYLDVALPVNQEEVVTTPLDADYLATVACSANGMVAVIFSDSYEDARAIRDLRRWRKTMKHKGGGQ